jgi:hypothetical protein
MFEVVAFLAYRRATPEGSYNPGSLIRLPYTLEGVSYTFRIDDPVAEPPFHIEEMWLYLRFSRSHPIGFTKRFALRVMELSDNNDRVPIPYPTVPPTLEPFGLGEFMFPGHSPVTSKPVVVRDLVLPRRGRYEFRLLAERKKPNWRGSMWRWVASHFIAVE